MKHTIEVVVDRLVAKGDDTGAKRRLTDSVETALGLAGGVLIVEFVDRDAKDPDRERRFSEKMACPNDHPLAMDEVEPRSFSFNSPVRRLPQVHRPRHRARGRPRAARPRRGPVPRRGRDRPVGAGLRFGRVLPAGHDRAGRGPEVLHGHAVARRCPSGPGGAAASARTTRSTSSTEPLRPRPVLHDRVRGRRALRQAPALRDRLRVEPRALRGLHARGAVPRVQGGAPEARVAGRPARRPQHLRGLRPAHRRLREVPAGGRLHRPRAADRRARHQGDRGPARLPARRRPRLPLARPAPPARCPAARRSGSGWPPRSAPGSSACSTSSTSRRSGCTSATTTA